MGQKRFVFALALWILSGCQPVSYELFINPDGSGKVVYQTTLVNQRYRDWGDDEATPQDENARMLSQAAALLKSHRGVVAWTDIQIEPREDGEDGEDEEDGEGLLTATGYFPHVDKVRLASLKDLGLLRMSVALDGSATAALEFRKADGEEKDAGEEGPELSEEELAALTASTKRQVWQGLTESGDQVEKLGWTIILHLPGPIRSINNMEKTDDHTARLVVNAETVRKFAGALKEDEEFWRYAALHGGLDGQLWPPDPLKYAKAVFGQEGGIEVSSEPGQQPLFDYAAESGKAAASWEAWLEAAEPKMAPPLGPAAEFSRLRAVGVQYVFRASSEQGVRPFGQELGGLRVAVIGELPGSILEVLDSQLIVFESTSGEDLVQLTERGVSGLENIQFSKDRSILLFEVPGRLTAEPEGFGRIEGKIRYRSASGSREVEYGPIPMEAGAADGTGRVRVAAFEKRRGYVDETLEFNFPASTVKSLKLYDEDGYEVSGYYESGTPRDDMDRSGESESEDAAKAAKSHTRRFIFRSQVPKVVTVVVEVYGKVNEGELTFKLENLDPFGRPVKPPDETEKAEETDK